MNITITNYTKMSQLVNTGMQRSLVLVVKKTVGSITTSQTYDGRLAFSSYGAISDLTLSRMALADYEQRLADFKAYVQSIIPGLDIDATTEAGRGAYRIAVDACPVGYTSQEIDDEVATTPSHDGTTTAPDAGSNTETSTSPSDIENPEQTTTPPMSLAEAIS